MMKPTIDSILVPTDFSDAAVKAFSHALRLAIALRAELDVFHVEPKLDTTDWHWQPGVVETLVRWGDLKPGAGIPDLERLGVRARRAMTSGVSADTAIFQEMASAHADLVVLPTHGRHGLERWLQPSVATPIALKGASLVLLLPPRSEGFVDKQTGIGGIGRVLIPIDHRPHPAPGFDAAVLLAKALPNPDIEIATLHVGGTLPETDLLRTPDDWRVHHWLEPDGGPVVEHIVNRAKSWNADLIVAVTEGRRNWLDSLRGSTVERLLARTQTPVLVVPADWTGED
jgi:nucleotide-binding universal stress UspA family protein